MTTSSTLPSHKDYYSYEVEVEVKYADSRINRERHYVNVRAFAECPECGGDWEGKKEETSPGVKYIVTDIQNSVEELDKEFNEWADAHFCKPDEGFVTE